MADPYIGEIRIFSGNYAPDGWLLCDGSQQSISTYEVLYSLIGTAFGGNGATTFGLPDLRGRVPVSQGTGNGLTARTLAQQGGSETVLLDATQIPNHTHAIMGSTSTPTSVGPANCLLSQSVVPTSPSTVINAYKNPAGLPVVPLAPQALLPAPATPPAAHANVMGSVVLNYIICYNGIYPTRP